MEVGGGDAQPCARGVRVRGGGQQRSGVHLRTFVQGVDDISQDLCDEVESWKLFKCAEKSVLERVRRRFELRELVYK